MAIARVAQTVTAHVMKILAVVVLGHQWIASEATAHLVMNEVHVTPIEVAPVLTMLAVVTVVLTMLAPAKMVMVAVALNTPDQIMLIAARDHSDLTRSLIAWTRTTTATSVAESSRRPPDFTANSARHMAHKPDQAEAAPVALRGLAAITPSHQAHNDSKVARHGLAVEAIQSLMVDAVDLHGRKRRVVVMANATRSKAKPVGATIAGRRLIIAVNRTEDTGGRPRVEAVEITAIEVMAPITAQTRSIADTATTTKVITEADLTVTIDTPMLNSRRKTTRKSSTIPRRLRQVTPQSQPRRKLKLLRCLSKQ